MKVTVLLYRVFFAVIVSLAVSYQQQLLNNGNYNDRYHQSATKVLEKSGNGIKALDNRFLHIDKRLEKAETLHRPTYLTESTSDGKILRRKRSPRRDSRQKQRKATKLKQNSRERQSRRSNSQERQARRRNSNERQTRHRNSRERQPKQMKPKQRKREPVHGQVHGQGHGQVHIQVHEQVYEQVNGQVHEQAHTQWQDYETELIEHDIEQDEGMQDYDIDKDEIEQGQEQEQIDIEPDGDTGEDEDVPYPFVQLEYRLQGSSDYNEGRLEIFDHTAHRWHSVCPHQGDAHTTTLVCKYLGFTRGADAVFQNGSSYQPDLDLPYDLVNIHQHPYCVQNEQTIEECQAEHSCTNRQSLAVRCRENINGCDKDWLTYNNSCYKFFDVEVAFEVAAAECKKIGAKSVSVETADEQHFLSTWLHHKVSGQALGVWTDGMSATVNTQHGILPFSLWSIILHQRPQQPEYSWKWTTNNELISGLQWFPGWPSNWHGDQPAVNSNKPCVALRNSFLDSREQPVTIQYFYAANEHCQDRLAVICEKEAVVMRHGGNEDCYQGNGQDYLGTMAVTTKGTRCLRWTISTYINPITHPNKGLGDHNHCRNPDNDTKPWCWVSTANDYGYCDVDQCPVTTTPTAIDCYNGNGADYRGTVSVTDKGTSCLDWTISTQTNPDLHPNKGLGEHNYCRNPDNDSKPWCWTSVNNSYGFCNVGQCPMSTTPSAPDCYYGNGEDYRGTVSITEKGTNCLDWTISVLTVPDLHPNKGLFAHNYCRNPDNDSKPWCWISINHDYGYCNIDKCPTDTSSTSTPAGTDGPSSGAPCTPDEFVCQGHFIRYCIPSSMVCNADKDCMYGQDEEGCDYLSHFQSHPGYCIELSDADTVEFTNRYINYTLQQCAQRCLSDKNMMCAGFAFYPLRAVCELYKSGVNVENLQPSEVADYYQYITAQGNCTMKGQFQCRNTKCISSDLMCNGRDDCHDFSDEQVCDSPPPLEVRLAGGTSEAEGRVEVKYLDEWGVICDDDWDISDAQVVCRQLGFVNALAAHGRSSFGQGNGNILLDDVECQGSERKLDDCQYKAGRTHDCTAYEIAGVTCKSAKACSDMDFVCARDNTCVPFRYVCDNITHCSDGSDEANCTVHIELIGGTNRKEGRVEIIRNGIRGTVCDDNFNVKAATVICKMIGYRIATDIFDGAHFGPGMGHIWLSNVRCFGNESSINQCEHSTWGVSNCVHNEDVGIQCSATSIVLTKPTTTVQPRPPTMPECGAVRISPRPVRSLPEGFDALIASRIVGGFEAAYGQFPWQAVLQSDQYGYGHYNLHCGASIISEHWIVSAAHCFRDTDGDYAKSIFRIKVGEWHLDRQDYEEQIFQIEDIIIHDNYVGKTTTYDTDIAMIKIKPADGGKGIQFGRYVQPICLPASNTNYTDGLPCFVSGFGDTSWGGSSSIKIKAAKVPLLSQQTCRQMYGAKITVHMVCAGYLEGGIDACYGDSGGPLSCEVNGKHYLYGITSWGRGCARANSPGVYSRVSLMVSWVNRIISTRSQV